MDGRMLARGSVPFLLIATFLCPPPAGAAWSSDPAIDLPVFTGGTAGSLPVAVTDGRGGAVVVWEDLRHSPGHDIYAQHILASGEIDPCWPSGGLAVSATEADEFGPILVYDGRDGVIVGWYLQEPPSPGSGARVMAKHMLLSGTFDPEWPEEGLVVSTPDAYPWPDAPKMTSDGAGGAFFAFGASGAWQSSCSCLAFVGIRVQHVLGSGVRDPRWPLDGRQVTAGKKAPFDDPGETIWDFVSDGKGGAILAWQERGGRLRALAAQHILASGELDNSWPTDGLTVLDDSFTAGGVAGRDPHMVADGDGGVFLTWPEDRGFVSQEDIFAQHVLARGTLDPHWPATGQPLCTAPFLQQFPAIAGNGRGGAFIAWEDNRAEDGNQYGGFTDIFGAYVEETGSSRARTNGSGICLSPGDQKGPTIVSDEAGGAIILWNDYRTAPRFGDREPFSDIYAQHLLRSGEADPAWPVGGQAVSTMPGAEGPPVAIADGKGGAIVVWSQGNIYAQRISQHGDLGGSKGTRGSASVPAGTQESSSYHSPSSQASEGIGLNLPGPNPARTSVNLGFALPRPAWVRLRIYDASGRLVRSLIDGQQDAGRQGLSWNFRDAEGLQVANGLYFARLDVDSTTFVRRLLKL